MKIRHATSLFAMLFLAVGCAGSTEPDDAESPTTSQDETAASAPVSATLAFAGAPDGGLFEGEAVRVTYDPSRITSCTKSSGDPHHGPDYDYELFYRWNADQSFRSVLVANPNGTAPATLTAPFGATDLEVYVQLTNGRGCSEYDSQNGANFHYAVGKARLPAIHFDRDGAVTQDGTLTAGAPLLVDYASQRLENCNQSGRKLKMFGRADGQDLPAQELAETSRYDRTIGRLTPPAGATHLELWFETIDFHACTQWDSQNGANFQFDLQ